MLAQISQRKNLIEACSKLQLLFSKSEVDGWTLIKKEVAVVLDLIERHEVWAELKTKDDQKSNQNTYNKIEWILQTSMKGLTLESGAHVDVRNAKKMLLNCNAVMALTKIFR